MLVLRALALEILCAKFAGISYASLRAVVQIEQRAPRQLFDQYVENPTLRTLKIRVSVVR